MGAGILRLLQVSISVYQPHLNGDEIRHRSGCTEPDHSHCNFVVHFDWSLAQVSGGRGFEFGLGHTKGVKMVPVATLPGAQHHMASSLLISRTYCTTNHTHVTKRS